MDGLQREENKAAQAEEMEALEAIYGDDYEFHPDGRYCEVTRTAAYRLEIDVHPAGEDRSQAVALRLRLYFVDSYPSASEPVTDFNAPWLSEGAKQKILLEFGEIYRQGGGDVVVFKWVDWLQGQLWVWEEAKSWMEKVVTRNEQNFKDEKRKEDCPQDRPMILKDSSQDNLPAERVEDEERRNLEELDDVLGIVHGPPLTERKSVFQAHLAPVQDVEQVKVVMDALLRNRKIAQATHNIMAYRIHVANKGSVLQDHDDDGETAAGGRLMHLLQIVDASNVMVVVSRWFGGVLLGPDRFRLINNTARSLLSTCGYINGSGSSKKGDLHNKTTTKVINTASKKGRKK